MKQKSMKIVLCAATAVLTFSSIHISAAAASSSAVFPSAGISLALTSPEAGRADSNQNSSDKTESNKTETEKKAEGSSDKATSSVSGNASLGLNETVGITSTLGGSTLETTTDSSVAESAKKVLEGETKVLTEEEIAKAKALEEERQEEESFKSLVIAKVNNYVNVRSTPSEEGEVVGKLYDKSVGSYLSEKDGWFEINSGSVTGYVKAEYCVTGEEAVELAKQVGTRIAKVTTTTLKVREQPGLDTTVLGLIPIEDQLLVTEEVDGWVKVNIEEGDGYVSRDYVTLSTEFVKAESKEEEEKRLAKEEAERKAAQAAARRAEEAANAKASEKASQSKKSEASQEKPSYTSSGGSEMGRKVADYGLQFVGNPYVYGGTSLTNGADCSGFVMSVYANFGVGLPHSSSADRSVGSAVNGLENAQPGDLICYSGHVALYIGNGQIVHASTAKTGIKVSNADYRTILSIRRIF